MPADIRNFFGGRPGATAPKQETALGTKDNVCALSPFVIFRSAIPGSVPEYQ
jgi:hypothetical protein